MNGVLDTRTIGLLVFRERWSYIWTCSP